MHVPNPVVGQYRLARIPIAATYGSLVSIAIFGIGMFGAAGLARLMRSEDELDAMFAGILFSALPALILGGYVAGRQMRVPPQRMVEWLCLLLATPGFWFVTVTLVSAGTLGGGISLLLFTFGFSAAGTIVGAAKGAPSQTDEAQPSPRT